MENTKQDVEKEIDYLIQIHEELKRQMVGSSSFHEGALLALKNLKIKLHGQTKQ